MTFLNSDEESLDAFLYTNDLTMNDLMLWIEFMNDLDYYSILIIKMLLKSTDVKTDEEILKTKEALNFLLKQGLNTYRTFNIESIILDSKYKNKSSYANSLFSTGGTAVSNFEIGWKSKLDKDPQVYAKNLYRCISSLKIEEVVSVLSHLYTSPLKLI